MSLRIAIIGAGWYGCHMANLLSKLSFDIKLFEKSNEVFNGSSGTNQNRLHQGYHYPRSHRTRIQSRDGYIRFIERYPALSKKIDNNVYAIPRYYSSLDFQTYKIIMASAGLEFSDVTQSVDYLQGIEGALRCEERLILTNKAKQYFSDKLQSYLVLNKEISLADINRGEVDGEKFDYFIDCTWGRLSQFKRELFFEKTIQLNYRLRPGCQFNTALTFVDGDLFSLFPTEHEGMYTLTHVTHTPVSVFDTADAFDPQVDSQLVADRKASMEHDIQRHFPQFLEYFEYQNYDISMKTKVRDDSDDRSCYIEHDGNTIKVLSGKIDTIFYASEKILSILTEHSAEHFVE